MLNYSMLVFPYETGLHYEDADTAVWSLIGKSGMSLLGGTYFVFVGAGRVLHNSTTMLQRGQYGCFLSGTLEANANAEVLVIQAKHYLGIPMVGGPIEPTGRLRYIDGCTDTGIIAPLRKGDPCLNHLHFPPRTVQSPHTHPDIRVGMVARGYGECITPWGNTPLSEGTQFVILPKNGQRHTGLDGREHEAGEHSFNTMASTMDVVAWHPTSDVGPTDEVHQMKVATHLIPAN